MPPKSKKPTVAAAMPQTEPASIAPLIKTAMWNLRYTELHQAYDMLADRYKDCMESYDGTPLPPGPLTKINRVDFAKPLGPLPESVPLKADSDANRFGVFVWGLLDACESGSIGGDACRMSTVLAAAVDDALDFRSKGDKFNHLLGLTLAIRNQECSSWFERGDPELGKAIFKAVGDEWRKLFALPEASLAKEGISPELRKFAIDYNEGLRKFLSKAKQNFGPYATNFTFNYITKPRATKTKLDEAAGSASASASNKRSKTTA
jgi:hypothetical protein